MDTQTKNRLSGVVKFFNEKAGYGFIRLDDGRELFVHASQVVENEPLMTGDRVSCVEDVGHKGPIARKVIRV